MKKEQILEAAEIANIVVSKAQMPVDYGTIFSIVIGAMTEGNVSNLSTNTATSAIAGVGRPGGE